MRRHNFQTLVLWIFGMTVGVVCSLAIPTSKLRPAHENSFSVSIQEKGMIRSAEGQLSERIYNCRASAKSCAIAAVQEACGNNEYEITFGTVNVRADGKLDGEWGYRCIARSDVL